MSGIERRDVLSVLLQTVEPMNDLLMGNLRGSPLDYLAA